MSQLKTGTSKRMLAFPSGSTVDEPSPFFSIQKTQFNVRLAYAQALEAAGLPHAMRQVDTLLDDKFQETFAQWFPSAAAFEVFVSRLGNCIYQVLKSLEWKADLKSLAVAPKHGQSIKNYFEKTFMPAVLAPESANGELGGKK